jgi:hypothetical protein
MSDFDDAAYLDVVAFVKKQRPRNLSKERLDITRFHAYFRYEGTPHADKLIASMLGRCNKLVKRIRSEYVNSRSVTASIVAANRSVHRTAVADTNMATTLVQEFVGNRRATRIRTIAKDVMMCLYEAGIIYFDVNDNKSRKVCLRSVQRFLARRGLKRGKNKGSQTYHLSQKNKILRDAYVQTMVAKVSAEVQHPVVYMDESYIHQHYAHHHDSLYDPNDTKDVATASLQQFWMGVSVVPRCWH